MSKEMIPFDYEGSKVRTVKDEKGDPWFIAVDICTVLGIKNVSDSCKRLKDKEKGDIVLTDT